ncbi:MAG: hypothetical protein V4613_10640 [Bacteroidota bacterium]
MKQPSIIIALVLLICSSVITGCKKNKGSDNPFDDWTTNDRGPVMQDLSIDPNSIAGLHKNIFKPTCANSGCHDGNFEPDFRSIESAYNSLINRMATNTDPQNPQFTKRVVPGDAANSMLLHRINTFIPGTQGKMPLSYDPGSDWPTKKAEYIQNIVTWINNGAKDQFGNSALSYDFPPQMAGLIAFADGSSTPLPHSGYNPVEIPAGTNTVKIMVAYTDDKTAVNQFGTTTLNYSLNPNSYTGSESPMSVETNPVSAKGFLGTNVDYWHSITLTVSTMGAAPNDVLWIRTETTDNVNPAIYIPSVPSSFNSKKYFAIRIK